MLMEKQIALLVIYLWEKNQVKQHLALYSKCGAINTCQILMLVKNLA